MNTDLDCNVFLWLFDGQWIFTLKIRKPKSENNRFTISLQLFVAKSSRMNVPP